MEAMILNIPKLDEIQNQIKELAKRITEIQKQDKSPKWFSNSDACKFLGVTPRTLQNYRDKGVISFSKSGSKIYYKQSDLEDHLESHYYPAFNKGRRAE
jgi:hypothetical protein